MAATGNEVESLLRRYTDDLVGVISHPNRLASGLFSRGIIGRGILEEASNDNKVASTRAINLLVAVQGIIKTNPSIFMQLMEVLRDELQHVSPLLDRIQHEYDQLGQETVDEGGNINNNSNGDGSGARQRRVPDQQTQDRDDQRQREAESRGDAVEDEISASTVIWVVIKGVGSVMLLSLVMWLGFMLVYSPPSKDQLMASETRVSQQQTAQSTGGIPSGCHSVDPTTAYEELQSEISDPKTLAIHLGLSKVDRDIIDRENQSEREKLIEVLATCHDLDKCACWEDIVVALEKYGNIRKAAEIKKKYSI